MSRAKRITVVRSCADQASLMAAIEEERPDAVLTDIRMPPTHTDEGLQVARAVRETDPGIGVVVLSQFADPGYVIELLDSGSDGRAYLLKERITEPAQLLEALETVVAGGSMIDPKVVEALVHARARVESSPLATLTPREHEVLAQVAEGKSNAAIAESLVLTKRAVEKHINSIFLKLDLATADSVSRRVKAALIFLAGEPADPCDDV
jgi:DNA-binding NarL/FixJ family response regulator